MDTYKENKKIRQVEIRRKSYFIIFIYFLIIKPVSTLALTSNLLEYTTNDFESDRVPYE